MKKKNILDLLFDDLRKQIELEESNFDSCIDDYNKCINEYIIPFIIDNQETFNLDFKFDLNSHDEIIRNKSTLLKEVLIYDFKKLLSTNPYFFKYHLENSDYKYKITIQKNYEIDMLEGSNSNDDNITKFGLSKITNSSPKIFYPDT